MKRTRTLGPAFLVIVALVFASPPAHAGVRIGVGIGFPFYPWAPCYPYYPYRPVYYYAPAPVFVSPPPVYLQPAPGAQPVYSSPAPPLSQVPAQPPVLSGGVSLTTTASTAEVERNLQMLSDPDERVRANSVTQLGRLKSARAVDPLAATLAGDRSPNVREAAARALAVIGSAKALPALQGAALNDGDRDVRRSAQFAIEIVQAGR